MDQQFSYINIHTHHVSADHGVYVFNNRFGHDSSYYTDSLFSVGVHPWDAASVGPDFIEALEALVAHPHCLAVGECGLDTLKGPGLDLQKQVFEQQLRLAVAHHKPVIIHCVKAFDELMELAKPYINQVPLIIHGFHKSSQLAAQLIARGFYLSLNPALLQREDFDFGQIPHQRFFLETDMLDNATIKHIYEAAALKFKMSPEALTEKINLNFIALKNDINGY